VNKPLQPQTTLQTIFLLYSICDIVLKTSLRKALVVFFICVYARACMYAYCVVRVFRFVHACMSQKRISTLTFNSL